jgi:hypothetical protein
LLAPQRGLTAIGHSQNPNTGDGVLQYPGNVKLWESPRQSRGFSPINNSAQQFREWDERNRGFHEALIAACDSRWLRYLIGILYRQSERYRRFALGSDSKRNVHAEHQEIYDAAMSRDEKRACTALELHISTTLFVLREAPSPPTQPPRRSKRDAMAPK